MKYAVVIFPTGYSIGIAELARAAEDRGFESLWVPEHTHIPASRRTPFPGGTELPRHYWSALDPFVGLATAAAVTTRLKVATGICLVVERDPIVLAKEIATLDTVSGGRFIFGIGAGWNVEEMENHGTPFAQRRRIMRERIEAMKAIWTRQAAEYHGEFVKFDPIWAEPKPVQKPHPPILMGGQAPAALRGAIEYCDGWMPIPARTPGDPVEAVNAFRRQAEAAGRDPKTLSVTFFFAQPDPAQIERFEAAGVERVIFNLPSEGSEVILPMLDKYARLIG